MSSQKPRRAAPGPAGFPGTDGRNADDKDGNAEAQTQLAGKNRRAKTPGS